MKGDLINWGMRKSIARISNILYHFQNNPYEFMPVIQIQRYIKKGSPIGWDGVIEKLADLRNIHASQK